MEFDGENFEYNIYDAMKYPQDDHSLCSIDVIDPIVQDVLDITCSDELKSVLEYDIDFPGLEYALSN